MQNRLRHVLVELRRLDAVNLSRIHFCSLSNGIRAEPHLVNFVKGNRAVKKDVTRNPFLKHFVRLPEIDQDNVRVSQDELCSEVDVIVVRQSRAARRILKDLGVASSGCVDQPLAGLPDCRNCEPVALLFVQIGTKFIIAIDDSGERFSDSRGILPEMNNAVESEETESCEEQAQLGWRALAAEDLSDRQLWCMVIEDIDCLIHHAK